MRDDKARQTFEIVTRTFDQLQSDLELARERGERYEREFTMQLATLLNERLITLCEKIRGFLEELENAVQSEEGAQSKTGVRYAGAPSNPGRPSGRRATIERDDRNSTETGNLWLRRRHARFK